MCMYGIATPPLKATENGILMIATPWQVHFSSHDSNSRPKTFPASGYNITEDYIIVQQNSMGIHDPDQADS